MAGFATTKKPRATSTKKKTTTATKKTKKVKDDVDTMTMAEAIDQA